MNEIDPIKEAALFRHEKTDGLSTEQIAGKYQVSRSYVKARERV
jgi:hypothetical protein